MQDDSFETVEPRIQPLVGQLLDKLEAKGGEGPVDVDKAWAAFAGGSASAAPSIAYLASRTSSTSASLNNGGSRRKWNGLWFGVALVVVSAATYIWGTGGVRHLPATALASKTFATTTGQRATVSLTNGAQVTLAPMTTLRVSGNEVELKGQAVFTVLHNKNIPFVVKTSNATVRVLGTTFEVRAYNSEERVAVAEGKVALGTSILSVGDIATVVNNNIQMQHNTNVTALLAWTKGELVFNATPLRDVIPELERWYGFKVSVTDQALLGQRITTTFTNESSNKVVSLIASALSARAIRNGQHVQFSPLE